MQVVENIGIRQAGKVAGRKANLGNKDRRGELLRGIWV